MADLTSTLKYCGRANHDGHYSPTAGKLFSTSGDPFMGQSSGLIYHWFFFLSDLPIPAGATITSAVVKWIAANNQGDRTTSLICKASDEDDATVPTSVATFEAKSWMGTTQAGTVTGAWTGGTEYSSFDVSAVVQAVIDRPGWAYRQNMLLCFFDNGTENNQARQVESMASNPGSCPIIEIAWTHPGIATRQIVAAADQGEWRGSSFVLDGWHGTNFGSEYNGFFRFLSCPIPQGTTLTSAILEHFINENFYFVTSLVIDYYGNDVDDAVAPTSAAEGAALAKTTAVTRQTWSSKPDYFAMTSLDVTAVVQEIVSRDLYAAGNDVQFIHDFISGGSDSRLIIQYYNPSSIRYLWRHLPLLYLEIPFSLGGGGSKIMMVL